jgi:ribosomal protein S12 methylthiotransferase accessory factor
MEYQYDKTARLIGKITIDIVVPKDFPGKYDSAVISAAELCTVKRHLKESIPVIITVSR